MLTNIGTQILNEFKCELETDVDDRKKEFIITNAGSCLKTLYHLMVRFFILGFQLFSMILTFIFIMIDESSLTALMNLPVSKLIEGKGFFVTFIFAIYIPVFFLYVINTLQHSRSAKTQHVDEDNAITRETTHHIELIEEVLHRHQLINKEEL